MTLRQQQSLFVRLVGQLIAHAYASGFELTFGEAWRSPEEFGIADEGVYSVSIKVNVTP